MLFGLKDIEEVVRTEEEDLENKVNNIGKNVIGYDKQPRTEDKLLNSIKIKHRSSR